MPKFLIITLINANFFLGACAVYKIDVQQGNVVTQAMLDQLTVGMAAKKVRFIMGTPVIIDLFHQQRWDYLYSLQAGGHERRQRHIALFFDEDEHLLRIEGDVTASTRDKSRPTPSLETPDSVPIL